MRSTRCCFGYNSLNSTFPPYLRSFSLVFTQDAHHER